MKEPKILFFDIETSPIIVLQKKWGLWDEKPIKEEVILDYQILSIAWMWDTDRKPTVRGQDDYKGYKPGRLNDYSLLKEFMKVAEQADVIVAHNGDKFDIKKFNTRLIVNGLPPMPPYKQYDTLKAYRRIASFTSNRLGDLAKQLGVAHKGDPGGFGTWEGCMSGDKKSWKHMKKYNAQDIPPLKGIYYKIIPYDKQAPNLNVISGHLDACPGCLAKGSLVKRGLKYNKTTIVQRYKCLDCDRWCQSRTNIQVKAQYTN